MTTKRLSPNDTNLPQALNMDRLAARLNKRTASMSKVAHPIWDVNTGKGGVALKRKQSESAQRERADAKLLGRTPDSK